MWRIDEPMDSKLFHRNLGTLDYYIKEKLAFRTICPHDDNPNALTLHVIRTMTSSARDASLYSDERTRERIFCRRVRYHNHGHRLSRRLILTGVIHYYVCLSITNSRCYAAGGRLSGDAKLHYGHYFSQARFNHPKSSQFRVKWVWYEAWTSNSSSCHGARVSCR